jgi:hypothetical protein
VNRAALVAQKTRWPTTRAQGCEGEGEGGSVVCGCVAAWPEREPTQHLIASGNPQSSRELMADETDGRGRSTRVARACRGRATRGEESGGWWMVAVEGSLHFSFHSSNVITMSSSRTK